MVVAAGSRLGPYEIAAPIGAGGMGEVYRARDTRLGRDVAIKVLPPSLASDPGRLRRFEKEARSTGALNHPNILAIYDVGTHEGSPYLVEELLEGQTLREVLEGGPLSPRKAVEVAVQVAHGLAAAHGKGIVHRDLKPSNLFLTSDGQVKILDFGLAKLVEGPLSPEEAARASTVMESTEAGAVLGTVGYMSPEQVRGLPCDHRTDIFAFGCVLYEMLSGRRAFEGSTPAVIAAAILNEDPPPLATLDPQLSPALDHVVARCLQKTTSDRFDSARDIAFALRAVTDPAIVVDASPAASRGRARVVFRVAATAVAAAAVIAAWQSVRWIGKDSSNLGWTPRQLTSAPGWEADPALSSDGSLVAYTSNESGNSDIWLVEATGGDPLQLTDDPGADYDPAWFPDGSTLAFVSERTGEPSIWKIPRLGGSPILLVAGALDPAVSPDGSRIAFARPGPAGLTRIAVTPLDDLADVELLTGDSDGLWNHEGPSWSPKGKNLCYADFRDLWLVAIDGGAAHRLTSEHAADSEPVWSQDGRYIYFASMREGTTALWRIRNSGGRPQRVTIGTGPEREPSVSVNGSRLAYSTYVDDRDVVIADLETGASRRLPGLRIEGSPDISPDGRSVVFVSNRRGLFDLWLQDLQDGRPTGDPRRLTDHPGSAATPRFSSDGRFIVYFRVLNEQRDIWLIPVAGGTPTRIIDSPGVDVHPDLSPDGTELAFVSDRDGGEHVWVCGFGGGRVQAPPRQITRGAMSDLFPDWSPDGIHIAYIAQRGQESDVWIVAARGDGQPSQLTHSAGAYMARWDPSGESLLVSGTWGAQKLELRRVSLFEGTSAPLEPPVDFGDEVVTDTFGLSLDGRFLVHGFAERRGDIWIMERTAEGR